VEDRNKKLSLFSALEYGSTLKRKFDYRGSTSRSSHVAAESIERQISLDMVTADLEICRTEGVPTFQEQLLQTGMNNSSQRPIAFTEADIQTIIQKILEDAVSICNIMLGLCRDSDSENENELFVRREANLFTNKPDHSAVYLRQCRVPIVTIEDKAGEESVDNKKVHGQVFDQLLESVLLSCTPSSIGAVTSVVKTRVAWIGEEANTVLTSSQELLNKETLQKCRDRLLKLEKSQTKTPPPKKTEGYPQEKQCRIEIEDNVTPARGAKRPRLDAQRKVYLSQAFEAESILHVFCNLIIAGILTHEAEREVYLLPHTDNVMNFKSCILLKTGKKMPMVGELKTDIKGQAKKNTAALSTCPPTPPRSLEGQTWLLSRWTTWRWFDEQGVPSSD